MHSYLIGVDGRTTPLGAREDVHRDRRRIERLISRQWRSRAALFSTCHRLEIYAQAKNADEAFVDLSILTGRFPVLGTYGCVLHGEGRLRRHALRLACGLESPLQGEAEVLSQIKGWIVRPEIPSFLRTFWGTVVPEAQNIRAVSGLDDVAGNIATMVLEDLSGRIPPVGTNRIVVVGTGKVAELFARERSLKGRLVFVAHKNIVKAGTLAEASEGEAVPWTKLPQILRETDVLISATASPHRVLGVGHFAAIADRSRPPLAVYDLAFPRDVDAAVRSLDGVVVKDLGDLSGPLERRNRRTVGPLEAAEKMIEAHQEEPLVSESR